jgi:hypothetical protein
MSSILFIAFTALFLTTPKSEGANIYLGGPIIIFLLDCIKPILFTVYLVNCNNYALCRSINPPYTITENNRTFVIMLITSVITVVLELLVIIATNIYLSQIAIVTKKEETSGMKRVGSKFLKYLPLPTFYYPADEINFSIILIYIVEGILVLTQWLKLWYKDRIVWTSDVVLPTAIPFYSVLPSFILSTVQIKYGDLYQVYFYVIDILSNVIIFLPILMIASHRLKSTFAKLNIIMVSITLILLIDVLLKTLILFTCRSNAICRTQYSPFLEKDTSLFYLVYYYTSVIVFILSGILTYQCASFRSAIIGLQADEAKDTGRHIIS